MTKNPANPRRMLALLCGVALTFGLSACDDVSDDDGFDDAAAQTCVATLTPQQIQQASASIPQGQPEKIETVCTYDPNSGDIHYYHERDGLQNWALYAAMTGRMSSFGSMYMLSGGDPFDAVLMDAMIGVNRAGTPFHPYSQIDGGYNRTPQVINNKTVTNVYYGSGKTATKQSYGDSLSKAPTGFKATSIPQSSSVKGAGDLGNGKPVAKVTAKPGVDGQSVSANAPVKRVAPGASVTNSAKSGGSSGSGSSGGSKSGSSSSSGSSSGKSGGSSSSSGGGRSSSSSSSSGGSGGGRR